MRVETHSTKAVQRHRQDRAWDPTRLTQLKASSGGRWLWKGVQGCPGLGWAGLGWFGKDCFSGTDKKGEKNSPYFGSSFLHCRLHSPK